MEPFKLSTSLAPLLVLLIAINSRAQIYTSLHNFPANSRDGYSPLTDLVLQNGTLYGTTPSGGTNGNGTIFKINTDGTGYAILFSLTNSPSPSGGMVCIGSTLYGTTFTGGAADNGSIFKINTDGSDYAELYSFSATMPSTFGTNTDGNRPQSDLVTDGTTLFGTTHYGGANGNGTIFKINTDGLGFTVIKTFPPTFLGTNNVSGNILVNTGTNSEGAYPIGGLVLDGTTLYGTAFKGGYSNGVVFAVQTDGSDYRVLKHFSTVNGIGTNSDGASPIAGLTLSGDALYGVTVGGGAGAVGNVFSLKTNGSDFVNLHDFTYDDGMFPRNSLLLDGSTLYGSTAAGGISNKGTIFMLQTNGSNFTILQQFTPTVGTQCDSRFVLSSNVLFGTTSSSGSNGGGVIFGLTVLPRILNDANLGIQSNAFGFDFTGISNQTAIIESSPGLSPPAWVPVQTNVLNGSPQHYIDNTSNQRISGFYRIHSP
jgi:uncharacterized repeat protein (TIGR03803 family)